MKRTTTESFVLTLPLRCEPWQRDELDKIFRVAGQMYNNLVAYRKRALAQMERTRAWKSIQSDLRALFQVPPTSEQKPALKALYTKRNSLLSSYGMSEYAFEARIQKWRRHHKKLIGTHIAQKIASAVWSKFEDYLFGSGKAVPFKPWQEFRSIEGKSNATGIRYRDGMVCINKMHIPVAAAANDYEAEALKRRVKFCRIVRIPWKNGWLYRLQLVLEELPPVKVKPDTGEMFHPMGKGRVGLDIGTQTFAFASASSVSLVELADKANLPWKKLRQVNRTMDRSRRAMNPQFFQADGVVIPVNNLPDELLDHRGKRNWVNSKRYERLAMQRRYLYAKLARVRRCQHQELANQLLACGDSFYVEDMNFRGLSKRARPQPLQPRKRYKRFGKSLANKAPALFLGILEKKVISQGGSFQKINTWKAKASQYNHLNQEYHKKKLSQRWNYLPDGHKVQRDLYSAFLIMHTNDTLDGFEQELCEQSFAKFLTLHDAEIERLQGVRTPSSTGVTYKA